LAVGHRRAVAAPNTDENALFFPPVGFIGPPPCGPRLRAGLLVLPPRANQAENGHGPVDSHGPAQYRYRKINFCFLLLFMMKNIMENVFVFI
jgi:hypothetical protein